MTENKKDDGLMGILNVVDDCLSKKKFAKAASILDNFPGDFDLSSMYNAIALGLTNEYLDANKKMQSATNTKKFAKNLIEGYQTKANSYNLDE